MKIGQALAQVKDLKGKINVLKNRIVSESYFKKILDTQEVPSLELSFQEFYDLNKQLRVLKTRIAKTNVVHRLSEKIHEMEMLRFVVSSLNELTNCKQEVVQLERTSYDGPGQPITTYATFNVKELASLVKLKQSRIRELDMELQQLNWTIDLED